jgi:NADPH-dependent 2,4-dienoyl-CoA reductase/sulfur reductase-like enzyme
VSGRLVVIGGGAAGMSAASAARRVDPTLEIVVLETGPDVAYGLCGIPYFLSGEVDRAEQLLAYPQEVFRDRRRIDLRTGAEVLSIDPRRRQLRYRHGGQVQTMHYHRLIVAAGGAAVVPPLPGLDDDAVFTVRTLESAVRLRSLLDAGRVGRAVVIGGGYVGLEMAEALHARGVAVTVVEMLSQVMPNLDEPMAALVEKELRRQGVDVRLSTALERVYRDRHGLHAVVGGDSLPVDAVILAVGVRAAGSVAAAAGAQTGPGGAVLVDDHMRTSLPDVFGCGDCIAAHHLVLRRPAFVPLGPAANKTGRVAGTVAAGGEARFRGMVGTAVVKVFDLTVARTGLTLAEAAAERLAPVATDVEGRSRAKYYPGSEPLMVRLVHGEGLRLLGAQMVGTDGVAKRIDVVAAGLLAGFDVDDLADLDLSYAPPYAPVYEPVLLAAQRASSRSRPAPMPA